ncbi:MAG: SLC13 family permease [Acidobacteriota bacterium]
MRQKIGLVSGPVVFLLVLLFTPNLSSPAVIVLASAALMAIWWITEALPIPATSLLPLVIFPLGSVIPASHVSTAYMDPNIVLFMGGFFLAMAIQKWGLHRRIALYIISFLGGNPRGLVLGFMLATAFLSMWVSNTATAVMMLPIGTAVVLHLQRNGMDAKSAFPPVLMLAIAYSASIGGVATLIGTPPNIVFAAQFGELFPERGQISFLRWCAVGLPFVIIFLPIAWLYLTCIFARLGKETLGEGSAVIEQERSKLGPMSRGERGVATIFFLTALAWIFRVDIVIGGFTIPGWASILGASQYVHDSTVAIISALLLFSIPVDWRQGIFLLDWDWAKRIPWGILILFGGGIALADGFQSTGLALWVGQSLEGLQGVPVVLLILSVCLLITFLTEVTSNTATATIFMPIMGGMAVALEIAPELLMIPATISASCAFMLPVATPPNAIVFASEHLSIPQMARAGLWLNLLGVLITTLIVYLFVGL